MMEETQIDPSRGNLPSTLAISAFEGRLAWIGSKLGLFTLINSYVDITHLGDPLNLQVRSLLPSKYSATGALSLRDVYCNTAHSNIVII